MSTAGILRAGDVVFYHPLDDRTERTQSQSWTGSGDFVGGKLPLTSPAGLSALATGDLVGLSPQDYDDSAGPPVAVKLAADLNLVVYGAGSPATLYARAAAFSGGVATFGAEFTVQTSLYLASEPRSYFVEGLDATRAVVAYTKTTASGWCRVLTVAGTTVAAGPEAQFNASGGGRSGLSEYIGIAATGAGKALLCFRDSTVQKGEARVLTVSGTDVTVGATTVFLDAAVKYVACAKIDSGSVAVAYADSNAAGFCAVATISGAAVAFGAAAECGPRMAVLLVEAAALSPGKVLAMYKCGSRGKLRAATVSGADIQWGAECDIGLASFWPYGPFGTGGVARLSATTAAVCYGGPGFAGSARLATVSGTTITLGAQTAFNPGPGVDGITCCIATAALDASRFVVAWRDYTNNPNGYGHCRVGTVSGTSVTFGGKATFIGTANTDYVAMDVLSSSTFLVCYKDGTDGKARVGTVSGGEITYGAAVTYASSPDIVFYFSAQRQSVVAMDASRAVVLYMKNTHVTGKVATVSGTDVTFGPACSVAIPSQVGPLGYPHQQSASRIDSTRLALVLAKYSTSATFDTNSAFVVTVSGNDLTFGPEASHSTGSDSASAWMSGGRAAVALSSGAVAVLWPDRAVFNAGYDIGSARVGAVSGSDVTFGPNATFSSYGALGCPQAANLEAGKLILLGHATAPVECGVPVVFAAMVAAASGGSLAFGNTLCLGTSGGTGQVMSMAVLDPTHVGIATRASAANARLLTVSGLSGTLGATESMPLTLNMWAAAVDGGNFAAYYIDTTGKMKLFTLEEAADIAASSGPAYPSAIGRTRVAVAMWAKNPTLNGATVSVRRGYAVTLAGASITLGAATATWTTNVGALMGSLNDGADHLLVLDFENTGGSNWAMRASVDGGAFSAAAAQDSGSQAPVAADTGPGVTLTPPSGGDQWIDELVLWAGDKASFPMFKSEELANLHDLADVFGDPMDQYEEDFGAPICWQATARMPDGSVWRDSGCGPCPPMVRVPRGASDIVVTDDAAAASPRIVEG